MTSFRLMFLWLVVFLFLPLCGQTASPKTVSGAVLHYGSLESITQDGFQRIIGTDSVGYVCFQHIAQKAWNPTISRQRAEQLKKAGKRLVVQIWWGPSGEFPWSKYSFANIALDAAIRADFFKLVVDPIITGYGAENLYGVHLLEESGMQFATDAGNRENPEDFATYTEPTSSYNTPWYSGFKSSPEGPDGGVKIANLRRHESDFTKMTGFKFSDVESNELAAHLFSRWISTRIQSGGQVEFAKYVHKTYPGLKTFNWDIINSAGENARTDHQLESQHFDGIMCNPYSSIAYNFCYQRAYRKLYPKGEIINFSMAGMGDSYYPYESANTRRARTAVAYLAGCDAFGFFEYPHDYTRPDAWSTNTGVFDAMSNLPRFRKTSKLLVISDGTGNVWHFPWAWTGLKYFDFLPAWEAHNVDLSLYDVVILHSNPAIGASGSSQIYWDSDALKQKYALPGYLDYREFDKFVASGGTLVLSGHTNLKQDCPLFVVREGYLHTGESSGGAAEPLTVSPQAWLKDKAGLKRTYTTSVMSIPITHDPERVTRTDAGYYLRHGKGSVFFFPFLRFYDPKEPYTSDMWKDYRQLLSDVTRGVLGMAGKRGIAKDYITDPLVGNYYLEAKSDSGQQSGYILLDGWPGMMTQEKWQVTGTDLFTGTADPSLCKDLTAVLCRSAK